MKGGRNDIIIISVYVSGKHHENLVNLVSWMCFWKLLLRCCLSTIYSRVLRLAGCKSLDCSDRKMSISKKCNEK